MGRLQTIGGPADVRAMSPEQLAELAVGDPRLPGRADVATRGGHLGPEPGRRRADHGAAPGLRLADRADPVRHRPPGYVHKIVTGRADGFDTLRSPERPVRLPEPGRESEHDWIENSHASTALSYADGLAKAFALRERARPDRGRGDRRRRADRRDGLGGAEQHRGGQDRPLVIVLNDNGRSYSPTTGGMAERLAATAAAARLRADARPGQGHPAARAGRGPAAVLGAARGEVGRQGLVPAAGDVRRTSA